MLKTISHRYIEKTISFNKNLIDQVRVKRENSKNAGVNATIDADDK